MTNKAFTLAEVLITLVVIGIVAVMTIPTTIKNYQKMTTVTKLKKSYSVMNQALQFSIAENGDSSGWDNPLDIGEQAFYEKYLHPYLKNTKTCKNLEDCSYERRGDLLSSFRYLNGKETGVTAVSLGRTTIVFPDGSIVIFFVSDFQYTKERNEVYIDINGTKKPNTVGKDVFSFVRTKDGKIIPTCNDYSETTVNADCSLTGTGICCSQKIIQDGWKISNEYPW